MLVWTPKKCIKCWGTKKVLFLQWFWLLILTLVAAASDLAELSDRDSKRCNMAHLFLNTPCNNKNTIEDQTNMVEYYTVCDLTSNECYSYEYQLYVMWPLLVNGVLWHVTLTCDWSFMTCDPYLWLEFSVKIRKYSSITFSPSSNHWKNNKTNKMIVVLFTVDKSLQI